MEDSTKFPQKTTNRPYHMIQESQFWYICKGREISIQKTNLQSHDHCSTIYYIVYYILYTISEIEIQPQVRRQMY